MDAYAHLKSYYEQYDEDGRLLTRYGMVEYLTTLRYIGRYLRPGMRVVEIGAGTGRYSHALAQQGYRVDAVELVPANIEVFRQRTQPGEQVTIRQGNALNLDGFADHTYEVTLLLGPMYHLYTKEDQLQALREALRVTKPGGVVFAAYCNNDATILQFAFQKGKLLEERYQRLIDRETFKASSEPEDLFQLYRKEDVDALMAHFDVKRLHYVGTDMAANFIRESLQAMDEGLFEEFLRWHFFICERPDMVGATHHMLDVFRKI